MFANSLRAEHVSFLMHGSNKLQNRSYTSTDDMKFTNSQTQEGFLKVEFKLWL